MNEADVRQGDVYWVDLGPAVTSAPAEWHPCVVVQSDRFNRSRLNTTVVCVITSSVLRAGDPGNVQLREGEAGLPKASVVNVTQVVTVDKVALGERIGKLSSNAMKFVRSGIYLLFE